MAGFTLGESSGFFAVTDEGKQMTEEAGQRSLKSFQDAKSTLSKLNEVTIGRFNKDTAKEKAELKARADSMTKEQRNDLIAKIQANRRDAANEAIANGDTNAAYEIMSQSSTMDSLSNEELIEKALELDIDKPPSIMDKLNDIVDHPTDYLNALGDKMKSNFCAAAPFPACSGCKNKPKTENAIPDFMKMIGDFIMDLQKGLEDAALALIGCPGIVGGLKQGLMNGGDFSGLTNAVKGAAISSVMSTAADVGSAAAFSAFESIAPADVRGLMGDRVGTLLGNTGKSGYPSICATMTGLAIAGDSLMHVASAAKNGDFRCAYGQLTARTSNRYRTDPRTGLLTENRSQGNTYNPFSIPTVKTNASPVQALVTASSQFATCASDLSKSTSTKRTRTRARFTANQMSALPGTTIGISTFKKAFALDSFKTGYRPPRGTQVRRLNGHSDRLI